MRPLVVLVALLLAAPFLTRPAAAQLAGTYTIDGTQPTGGTNYASFADAVAVLGAQGVSGAVTFEVAPGSYAEQVTVPAFPGASFTNRVTFRGVPGGGGALPTVRYAATGAADDWVLKVDGASFVTVERLRITTPNPFQALGTMVVVAEGAQQVWLLDCEVDGIPAAFAGPAAYAVLVQASRTRLVGGTIEGGSHGVAFVPPPGQTLGSLHLEDVTITGPRDRGVYAERLSSPGDTPLQITGVAVTHTASAAGFVGVEVRDGAGGVLLEESRVSIVDGTAIRFEDLVEVDENQYVHNSFLAVSGTGTALDVVDADRLSLVHTTLHVGAGGAPALRITTGSAAAQLRNLLVAHRGSGAHLHVESAADVAASDYAVFDGEGRAAPFLASWAGTAHPTLDAYQAASGHDAHSRTRDVTFVDAAAGDLHLGGDSDGDAFLGGAAGALPRDIDGDVRSAAYPYAGADEAATPLTAPPLVLAGTYTIDASLPTGGTNFASFSDVRAALEDGGVGGAVTFEVAAGTYGGSSSWSIQPISGVSAARTVRFVRAPGAATRPVILVPVGNPLVVYSDHVTFDGLEITSLWFQDVAHGALVDGASQRVRVVNSEDILIEGNVITTPMDHAGDGVYISEQTVGVTVRGNTITAAGNGVEIRAGSAGVLVEGNTIVIPDGPHTSAGVYVQDDVEGLTIRGNVIRKGTTGPASYGVFLYAMRGALTIEANEVFCENGVGIWLVERPGPNRLPGPLTIVNNTVRMESGAGLDLRWHPGVDYPVAVAHNTVVSGATALRTNGGSYEISRNVLVALGTTGHAVHMDTSPRVLDYDVLYAVGGGLARIGSVTYADLAALQAHSSGQREPNGASFIPTFEDVLEGDLHVPGGDGRLAAPRLAAVPTDLDGDVRPGVTYRGADEAPVPLASTLLVRAFLQGAYDAGSGAMRADLDAAGLLPLAQPYADPAFDGTALDHDGTEATTPAVLAAHDVVDWVLVELRAAPDGAPFLRRAALLLADGSVRSADGAEGVSYTGGGGALYAAVYHRNHLGAMAPATGPSGSATADLAAGVYGASGAVEVGTGVWALWGGNGDGDGGVLAPDRQGVWEPAVGQTGYALGDYTLDGSVLADDRQVIWEPNVGAQSAIPGQSLAPEGPGAAEARRPDGHR